MMVDKVIEDNGLRATIEGFTLKVRLPWYRSLPLSTVDVVSLSVDREAIPAAFIRFALNGGEWSVREMPRLTDQFWFVIDSGTLHVTRHPLERGTDHDIEVVLALYPPYIKGLRRMVRWTKKLRVA